MISIEFEAARREMETTIQEAERCGQAATHQVATRRALLDRTAEGGCPRMI